MKLREKILIPTSLILILGMSTISLILYTNFKSEIRRIIESEMNQVADMLLRDLDSYHVKSKNDVSIFSTNTVFTEFTGSRSDESLGRAVSELKKIKNGREEYESLGIADTSGMIIACDNEALINKVSIGDRDYFKLSMQGKTAAGAVSMSKVTENPIFGTATPIINNGKITAVFFAVIDQTYFNSNYLDHIKIGSTGYAFLSDGDGIMIGYPDKTQLLKFDLKTYDFGREIVSNKTGIIHYKFKGASKTNIYKESAESGWIIGVTAEDSDIFSVITRLLRLSIIITAVCFVIGLIVIFLVTRSIVSPIRITAGYANLLSEGDLKIDFDERMLRRKDETGELAGSFNALIKKLNEIVLEVIEASEIVSRGSSQLTSTSEQLSQGATEQASISEEVSSSIEEISSSIDQNKDNAYQTERIGAQAAEDADAGGAAVNETVEAMRNIAEKIKVIDEIARQTNLLSLNAAIEAARAGEYGKGFAVVAAEVGKLAANSQKASTEIFEIANESVKKAEHAGTVISEMIPNIRKTADLVQEISATSLEQSTGAQQISTVIMQLDQVIQTNAASAEESLAMAEELYSQAENLGKLISFFKIRNNASGKNSAEGDKSLNDKAAGQRNNEPARLAAPAKKPPVKKVNQITEDDADMLFEEF